MKIELEIFKTSEKMPEIEGEIIGFYKRHFRQGYRVIALHYFVVNGNIFWKAEGHLFEAPLYWAYMPQIEGIENEN